ADARLLPRLGRRPAHGVRADDRATAGAVEGGRRQLAGDRDLLHRRAVQPACPSVYRDRRRAVLCRHPGVHGADVRSLFHLQPLPGAMGPRRAASARVGARCGVAARGDAGTRRRRRRRRRVRPAGPRGKSPVDDLAVSMSSVVRSVVAAAIAAAVIERGGTAQQPPSPGTWVTAWASSPQALGTKTISNATVRMIGRATLAGSAVRVRIDNTFGPAPLAVGAAYVGEPLTTRSGDSASRGAALVAGSNRQLKFGGAAGVVVPQGGSVVSDGVSMAVGAHQDLAVSLYIAEAGVRPTQHASAQVRSYLTANDAGNAAAAESKSLFTQSTSSLFWLSGIDVLAPAATAGAIVALGDSITDGTCSSFDGHDRWLDWLAARLDAAGDAKAVVNAGIGSDTVTAVSGFSVPPGVVRLERDVLTLSGVSHVILLMGINDIRLGATAA